MVEKNQNQASANPIRIDVGSRTAFSKLIGNIDGVKQKPYDSMRAQEPAYVRACYNTFFVGGGRVPNNESRQIKYEALHCLFRVFAMDFR